MAPRLVHNALGPMAHKTKGMRWRIQGVCLRYDRGPDGVRWVQTANGWPNDVTCHFWVCAGYKKSTADPADPGARPQITPEGSGEPAKC